MGVFLFLCGLAGFLVCALWLIISAVRKRPLKQAAIGLLASVALIVFGAAASGPATTEAAPPELSEASLTAIVQKLGGVKPEGISVSLSGGFCEVSYADAETHWDESRMIGAEMSALINFCREAFALEGLEEVKWSASVEMLDARGNASIEKAVEIDIMREAFAAYDWDNLEYQRIYPQFSSDCVKFWVRSSIMNKANPDDIYYSP